MIRACGIDPGVGCSAIAVVDYDGPGEPATLAGLWCAYGAYPDKWGARMVGAVEAAAGLRPESAWIEKMPVTRRAANVANLVGPAEAGGQIIRRWHTVTGEYPHPVLPRTWWAAVGLRKKHGDGRHRIKEAAVRVHGAAAALVSTPKTRQVDCAEAILIAYAGCLLHKD